jgi:hypothetical protein
VANWLSFMTIMTLGVAAFPYPFQFQSDNVEACNYPFDARLNVPSNEIATEFILHVDVLLPLCLKSIVTACVEDQTSSKAIVDDDLLRLICRFIEMLTCGLIDQALAALPSSTEECEASLRTALQSSEIIVDFLAGLL